jgi:hypothetical protein
MTKTAVVSLNTIKDFDFEEVTTIHVVTILWPNRKAVRKTFKDRDRALGFVSWVTELYEACDIDVKSFV